MQTLIHFYRLIRPYWCNRKQWLAWLLLVGVSGALTDNWQVGLGYTYTKSVFMEDEGSNFRIDASIRNTIYQIILARPEPITTTANRVISYLV